jgi:predicted RNase H-like nuclease
MGVLGVDACRKGWAGILLDGGDLAHGVFGRSLDELVGRARCIAALDVIGIDMPIGLPDTGRRAADVQAKELAGPRRSSVFLTPVRPAVEAPSYRDAARLNRALAGEGLSVQAYALAPRILDVDAWVRGVGEGAGPDVGRGAATTAIEVHPELSFAAMAGHPLPASKHTWAGASARRQRLVDAGVVLPDELGGLGASAAVDDVLDAAAAAWTARRHAAGRAICIPARPETFSDGWPAAIWR